VLGRPQVLAVLTIDMVPRRKLWVVQGTIGSDARRRWLQRRSGFGLVTPHRRARPIVPRPCGSPSSPAPSAHRYAAAGLDRDTPGREFCIGAVNDAIGSSPRWSCERFGGG
jgi:hypothetical protein